MVYYIRNNANKCKASYFIFDTKKGYSTFSFGRSRRLRNYFKNSDRNSKGTGLSITLEISTVRNHAKNAKPACFFRQKKRLLNFFFWQKHMTVELSQEFQGNERLCQLHYKPWKKCKASFLFRKRVLNLFF